MKDKLTRNEHAGTNDYKSNLIELMATSGVLMFGDFTLKSGRQSPYFFNSGQYKTAEQAERLSEYYAALIHEKLRGKFDVLFGPAYKAIPLCTLAAAALFRLYGINAGYCFNRKEVKTHGDGGMFVGHQPAGGDRFLIIEDVISAGTSVREVYPLLKSAADVQITDMVISIDRIERGAGGLTASAELHRDFGITVHPLVTVVEIIEHLHNREIGGKVYIDDEIRGKMEAYIAKHCVV
ncbi:MAG: orotate phosphoribosyltransferase [Defluviitaleaceae bacterium]|nr:orotate phosphoribosyltransferase [Defluviitaleaceae bacterium]